MMTALPRERACIRADRYQTLRRLPILVKKRPVFLLNFIRKVFSLIVLGHVHEQVDRYLPTCQSAFHKGRSLADIIFAKRVLSKMVQDKVT